MKPFRSRSRRLSCLTAAALRLVGRLPALRATFPLNISDASVQLGDELAHAAPQHIKLSPPSRGVVLVLVAVVECVEDLERWSETVGCGL